MRSFVVLLLLVVVFLAGMLIGIDKERQAMISEEQVGSTEQESDAHAKTVEDPPPREEREKVNYEAVSKIEGPEQTTQKMAFFLEEIVKGFYEIIVEVLYQITSLFV